MITKIAKSRGLILGAAIMDMARLKVGDQVNMELHLGGTLTITPLKSSIGPVRTAASAKRLVSKNPKLFRSLAR